MRVGILLSHPVQYYSPWFRALAEKVELHVFYAHRQSAEQQAEAGFRQAFNWDSDLLSGYKHTFLKNVAKRPGVIRYGDADTPDVVQHIKDGQFDVFVVCGWYLKSYWQAVRACRRFGVPVFCRGDSQLATPRSPAKRLLKWLVFKQMLSRFDGFLAVGRRFHEYLSYYGVPNTKIFHVPHFVDTEWFRRSSFISTAERDALRRSWGAAPQHDVVTFVGKFIAEKNPDEFLDGIRVLGTTQESVIGVMIGAGPLESHIRARVAAEELPVHFAGFKNQSELPKCYAASDVLALTSQSETWGLVVNESLACGTPVVVSDLVGCAPDLVQLKGTGFVYRSGNADELAEALGRVLEMRRAGHDFITALAERTEEYSIAEAVSSSLAAFEQLSGCTQP